MVPSLLASRGAPFLLVCLCGWSLLGTSLLSLAQAPIQPGPPPRKAATHDAISEADLRNQVENARRSSATVVARTKPVASTPPSTQSSLLTSSHLISDGASHFTVVPIGSVLVLPSALRSRVVQKPTGDLMMWPDFLKKNTSWLSTKEVSLEMSRGDSKAGAQVLRELSGESRLVVAVYKGGPITVLEAAPANAVSGAKKSTTP